MGKRDGQRPPGPPAAGGDAGSPGKGGGSAPFPVHEHVGRQLKALFDEVTTQPIPDKLVELLEELERKHSKPPVPPKPK
jgi:Anti-sigma factor NepR